MNQTACYLVHRGPGYSCAACEIESLRARLVEVERERDEAIRFHSNEFRDRVALQRERDALREVLRAARQFLALDVDRGPDVNGWQNTLDAVDAALSEK